MKKRVVFRAVLVVLPVGLLGATYAIQDTLSWRPQLVGTDPDGVCKITWSRDSRLVQLEPVNIMQNLAWNTVTFDINRLKQVSNDSFATMAPLSLECNQPFEQGATQFKGDALSVCRSGQCVPLKGTDARRFGETVQTDPTSVSWNFDDSQFSSDESEISILSDKARWTWSTQSGDLLRREPLQVYGVRFSSSPDVFWSSDGEFGTATRFQFFDGKSGALLWRCGSSANPAFDREKNLAIIAGSNGCEMRDIHTGRIDHVIEGPSSDAAVLAVSPDEKWLWSSHKDGQIWQHRLQ